MMTPIARQTPNDGAVLLGGMQPRLLLTGPAPLADVLTRSPYDFAKFERIRDFLRPILGNGLVVVEGDKHRFLRRNMQPAFAFRHVRDLYPMMWEKAVALAQVLVALGPKAAGPAGDTATVHTEINAWASKVTLDIIGVAGFGRDLGTLHDPDAPLAVSYLTLLKPSRERLLYFLASTWLSHRVVRMLPWRLNNMFDETTSRIRSTCGRLCRDKRAAMAKAAGDDHLDILSLLIKSDDFSEGELVDQLLTILAAG